MKRRDRERTRRVPQQALKAGCKNEDYFHVNLVFMGAVITEPLKLSSIYPHVRCPHPIYALWPGAGGGASIRGRHL